MGFIKKLLGQEKTKDAAPAMQSNGEGQISSREWWPDLTAYRKAILLHGISYAELEALLVEYSQLTTDKVKAECEFCFTVLPDHEEWTYLEFPTFEGIPHYLSFWDYQNLVIWLTEKADRDFCLAIPKQPNAPLFLSEPDRANPYGDSCKGIYADRQFVFEVPGEILRWGAIPTEPFDYVGYLKKVFQFDTQWIPMVANSKWERVRVTMTFPEE